MIKKKLIQQAVEILRDLNKKYYEDSSKKKPLLEDEKECTIYLQVTLKKIPQSKLIKMIKVHLPHRLLRDSDEVCLILGDTDKKNHKAEIEPDILHYKQLLEKHGITCISEVITLRQLRTDYKPYEAKQKLLAAYNTFLTDSRIAECLPKLLGKHFFRKRKYPIQIDMKSSNLKQHIEKALSTKVFSVTGHGNNCCSEVAYLDMDDSEILDNVVAVTKTLSSQLPGLWDNVMGVYLKTAKSKAIPVFMSYENSSEIHLKEEVKENTVVDELSTIPNVRVKVYSDGRVKAFHFKEDVEIEEYEVESTIPEMLEESGKGTKKSKTKKKNDEAKSLLTESDQFNSKDKILENADDFSLQRDLEQVNSQESVKESKKSKKAKKRLTEMELILPVSNDSESDTTTVIRSKKKIEESSSRKNLKQVNSQESVKEGKKSKKAKKRLTEMELILPVSNDSESDTTTVTQSKKKIEESSSRKNLEQVNAQESVRKSKKSKKGKKQLTEMELILPVSNDSESDITTVIQSKKKKKIEESSSRKKQVNSQELGKEAKNSKKSKKGLTEIELIMPVSDESEGDSKAVIQSKKKKKIHECSSPNDHSCGTNSEEGNSQESVKETKKSRKAKKCLTEIDLILPVCDDSESKTKARKFQREKKIEESSLGEKDPMEKIKKLNLTKRKLTELASADHDEGENSNEMPMQSFKKRRVDGLNIKKYNAKKKCRKSKKKKEISSKE